MRVDAETFLLVGLNMKNMRLLTWICTSIVGFAMAKSAVSCENSEERFQDLLNSVESFRAGDSVKPSRSDGVEPPVKPTGLSVTGAFSAIGLRWNTPIYDYQGHAFTRVYRGASDNLRLAIVLAETPGNAYSDQGLGGGASFYYWIKHVNSDGLEGAANSCNGTLGETVRF